VQDSLTQGKVDFLLHSSATYSIKYERFYGGGLENHGCEFGEKFKLNIHNCSVYLNR
jgi:hypothetical protein